MAPELPEPPVSTPAGQGPRFPVLAASSSAAVTLDVDPTGGRGGTTIVHISGGTAKEPGNRGATRGKPGKRTRIGVPFATCEILAASGSAAGQPDRPSISCTRTDIAVVFQDMFYLWRQDLNSIAPPAAEVADSVPAIRPNDGTDPAVAVESHPPLGASGGAQWAAMLLPEPCVSGGVRADVLFALSSAGRLHLWRPEAMQLIGSVELGEVSLFVRARARLRWCVRLFVSLFGWFLSRGVKTGKGRVMAPGLTRIHHHSDHRTTHPPGRVRMIGA